jgi:hypothetical protein
MNILDIVTGFIANVIFFIAGWITRIIYNKIYIKVKQMQVKFFFGRSSTRKDRLVIVCPRFKPLTYNEFERRIKKTIMLKDDNTISMRVPILSDVIVKNDLEAIEKLKKLFSAYKINQPLVHYDDRMYNSWNEYPCRICIGSPRSNNIIRRVLNDHKIKKFITYEHRGKTLDSLTLRINGINYGIKKGLGLGVLVRLLNPADENELIIGLFGCCGATTLATCEYFQVNFQSIVKKIKEKCKKKNVPSIILLSFSMSEKKEPGNGKIILIETPHISDELLKYKKI